MTNNEHILIIAPHPDDDVIGMGGTIAIKAELGASFTIVYVTNGAGTVKTEEYKNLASSEIINLRKKEAEQSLIPLIKDFAKVEQLFLGLDSKDLISNNELYTTELEKVLRSKKFDSAYIPYFKDRHPTHRVIAELSEELITVGFKNIALYAYETWDAIPMSDETVVVDISNYSKQKLNAVSCHKSQCSITPFDEGIMAKNRYNAVFNQINSKNKMTHAELFLKLN